jgi:hypothetical protein
MAYLTPPGSLTTSPGTLQIASTDVLPLGCDSTPLLLAGEFATGIATSLTRLDQNIAVVLPDEPTLSAPLATQIIRGATLTVGVRYRLVWTFTLNSGATLSEQTFLDCVF